MNKDTELRQRFLDAGWRLIRSKGHMLWACPCGKHLITSPHSVGRPRGEKNTIAQLKKFTKECTTNIPAQR